MKDILLTVPDALKVKLDLKRAEGYTLKAISVTCWRRPWRTPARSASAQGPEGHPMTALGTHHADAGRQSEDRRGG